MCPCDSLFHKHLKPIKKQNMMSVSNNIFISSIMNFSKVTMWNMCLVTMCLVK